jgi:hypothetical protein
MATIDEERAGKIFRQYVRENYPTGVRIDDPDWHAPKLFRAALRAIKESVSTGVSTQAEKTV